MKLTADEARERLNAADHGVLSTLNVDRGIDSVPVVLAVDDDRIGIPIDRVKPKSSTRLQRKDNLEADPRATLLVQQWDSTDWSRLWWVRVNLVADPDPSSEHTVALSKMLAARYPQYRDEPFERIMVLRIVGITGWSAS